MTTLSLEPGLQSQIEEIVDRALRARPQPFNAERQDQLDGVAAAVTVMRQDASLGRALSGPTWLSGISVLDGTINAEKLNVTELNAVTANTGALNVTGTITAAASYPAVGQRIELNDVGLFGYNSTPSEVFRLLTTGAGFIGVGATRMSWDSAGVVTIPVASIGSLTIAAVGSGDIGGTYQSSSANTRFELSPTEFKALSSGSTTFRIAAATGAVEMYGAFTVKSSISGAHITIDNAGGIAGYSGGAEITSQRMFLLNAATGAGHLGRSDGSNPGISWDNLGNVSIGGSVFSGGKITAGSISVSSLSALTATLGSVNSGTITASVVQTAASGQRAVFDTAGISLYNSGGTNTVYMGNNGSGWIGYNGSVTAISWTTGGVASINASRIVTGSLTFGAGTVNSTGTIAGTLGDISLGNLTVSGVLDLGSGGRIEDDDGSYWDQDGITMFSPSTIGDSIIWKYSGWTANRPYSMLRAGNTSGGENYLGMRVRWGTGASYTAEANVLAAQDASLPFVRLSATPTVGGGIDSTLTVSGSTSSANSNIAAVVHGRSIMDMRYTNYATSFGGRIYPGPETGSYQTGTYLKSLGTDMDVVLSDSAGSSALVVRDSGTNAVWHVNSDGRMALVGDTSGGAGALYGRVPVLHNGTLKYLRVYDS